MRIRRTSNVPFYGRNNGILMNLSEWCFTLTLRWHWSPKMNNDLFNLRTWRVLQFTVLSGGHNSIGYHHQTMGVQTVLTTTGRVKPPVSSFTGSVSTSTLWIYRKLIFTWFKLDGRQKKTLWDIKKSARCMFLTRNWQLKLLSRHRIFCCSYSVGCRWKGIRFPTSTRKSDLSLHWRFGYEKKLSQLKK